MGAARRGNLAGLACLQLLLLAAQSTTGCLAESVPIGAIDAGAGGEGATDGAAGSSGTTNTGGSSGFAAGGTGKGGSTGRGGTTARGGSFGMGASSGATDPAGAGTGGTNGGSSGSSGQSEVGGTVGIAGDGGVGGTSGTAGDAGSAGSAGSGLTAGDGGTAGVVGTAGSAGSAGEWNDDPTVPWIIGAPTDIGCTSGAPCTARFQWRDSTIPVGSSMGDYIVRDVSADGQWLVGTISGAGARQGSFKSTWDATELGLLLSGEPIDVVAVSADGDTSVGFSTLCPVTDGDCASWAASYTGEGPTTYFDGVPQDYYGFAVSSDGSVKVARGYNGTGSYVLRNGVTTHISGVNLEAVSHDGRILGGQRRDAGAVIVDDTTVIDLPPAGAWTPLMVTALNEDGSVAVGYAENPSLLTQAFRWVRGGELTLLGIPEGTQVSAAEDCDASGDLVVGTAHPLTSDATEPFLYRPNVGLRTLREDLLSHSVPLIPAELFISGVRVSADGTRIVGSGTRGTDNIAWVADYLTGPALVSDGDP